VSDETFLLPDLGEGLSEGEVVSWLVQPGDTVEIDQPVAEVETAKAVVEVPSPFSGSVLALHAEPGDAVAVGQPLMTVSVSVSAGIGEQAGAQAGGSLAAETGGPAADHGESGQDQLLVGTGVSQGRGRRRRGHAPVGGDGRAQARAAGSHAADATGRPLAKPPVRKLAKDLGVDLAQVPPSGPGGVITRRDVEAVAASPTAGGQPAAPQPTTGGPGPADPMGLLAEAPAPAEPRPGGPEPVERRPLTGVRRTIAAQMTRSRAEIPEAVTWVDCDATELMRLRDELNASVARQGGAGAGPDPSKAAPAPVRVSPLALILRACVAGLGRVPEVNSRLDPEAGEIVVQRFVNLGVAAQTDAGLMVPVIHGAERMSTVELAAELARLTTAARERTLGPGELRGSTFTVSNYGAFGVDGGDMVINYPEAAVLGVGRIAQRPWVVDGAVAARQVVNLSIAFDHRVCDGGEAAGFLRFVADCVESPRRLLAEL
jgi:pyruvate dehydrogenase E2 component (dihydrolipoamide acetyltransferase)